jgi:peptidoglycan/LPS O-acetylase OafA/YrhL
MDQPSARVDSPSRAALDGIRGLAVVLLVLGHSTSLFKGGYIGADVFFVVSGYAITAALVTEHEINGTVRLGAFYARRALRILPAFAVAVALAGILAATTAPGAWSHPTFSGLPWVILFVGDFAAGFSHAFYVLGVLQHTWLVSLEAQFFLVWAPVCVFLLARRPRAWLSCLLAVLAVLDVALNLALSGPSPQFSYFSPVGHSMGLLAGCAVALAMSDPRVRARIAAAPGLVRLSGLTAIVAILIIAVTIPVGGERQSLAIAVTSAAAVALVASVLVSPAGRLAGILGSRIGVWTGRRAYGIYLYHFVLLRGLFPGVGPFSLTGKSESPVELVIALAVTLAVAAASFKFVEQPLLGMRSRFAPA